LCETAIEELSNVLRGSAKCLRNIQQFNFLFISHNELFLINCFTLDFFPLRDVHTIVDVKRIKF